MVGLSAFHGVLATVVLAMLILTEEAGVPLPMAPGDLVLITAGVLIGSGAMSPWAFVPAAVVAGIAGGLAGYTWSRAVGRKGLRAVAERLRIGHRLERVEARIQGAGVTGLVVSRLLVPGMRVNTTLLAGALGVPRRTFVLALVPSVLIWVGVFTSLGVLVGVPVEHLLARADQVALQGAELLAVGAAAYVAARHAPSRRRDEDPMLLAPAWGRLTLAAVTDLTAIATIVTGADVIGHYVLRLESIDDLLDASITAAVTIAAYFLAARGVAGRTAGEALFRVSYRRREP